MEAPIKGWGKEGRGEERREGRREQGELKKPKTLSNYVQLPDQS